MNQEVMSPQTEQQADGAKKKPKNLVNLLFDIAEMFIWSVFVVMFLFTCFFRLCRVDGSSMENTLHNAENLLVSDVGYTPKQDDIIVFHLTRKDVSPPLEKNLVKRVIATEGQSVEINFQTKEIFVDGVLYADSHAVLKTIAGRIIDEYTVKADHHYDAEKEIFSATVPEGHVFVLGDNRNNSKDSRDDDVGFVDMRCILGKAILRIHPFTIFES